MGTTTLEPEPTINHISGGGNPTFTVTVENDGEFTETNVKVDVTVTAGGKQYKASQVINKTEPGKKVNVEIPVTGDPARRGREDRSPRSSRCPAKPTTKATRAPTWRSSPNRPNRAGAATPGGATPCARGCASG